MFCMPVPVLVGQVLQQVDLNVICHSDGFGDSAKLPLNFSRLT